MGFSCKSKSAIAVCNSTGTASSSHRNNNNGTFLESFRFRDLETATNWFSRDNLILKTSHGHLYRANLSDGRVVTVKRPDTTQRSHEEAFDNEVQILSKVFSRRLVNLLGCSRDGRDGRVKLLVLEYMDNGPLHENLTEPVVSLSWPMRVKLAVDIAKAIRALHASSPPIVHSNLRSTNVFLDSDGSARLGDFCLAKVLPEQAEPPRRSTLISIPEMATEEDYGRRSLDDLDVDDKTTSSASASVTPKLDVYSFGILLLEIMSGQTGTDDHPRGLLDWALPLIKHGHFMAICDPRITPFPDSAAVRIMATMAARCVSSASSRRPAMEEVVQCLVKASKLVPEPLWTTSTSTISTPLYPELTPSTSTSRELKAQITTRAKSMSCHREMLVNSNLDVSTPSALGFPNPTKKTKTKRTLVFRLGRFVVRKLKIARRGSSYGGSSYGFSYDKLPVGKKAKSSALRSPLTASKVSDDLDFREELDHGLRYQKKPESKKGRSLEKASNSSSRFTAYYSSSTNNHRSGKKFARL